VRAQQERDEAVALGAHFRNAFALKQIYTQAETAYWTVAGYQEILRVQKENLERAQKLVASSKSKVSLDLADKTDLLQAESALRVRELELAQSNSEFRTASRQFNSLRGVDSDSIEEKLASVYIDEIEKVGPPTRGGVREDVAAAQQDAKVAFSNARLGAERNKPTLEAYVSHAFTGRDATLNSALQMMTRSIYTFSTVGVRFATPLNFGMLSADREAYVKEQAAADLNLSRKQFEQENEWRELSRRLLEGKEKLQLARSLEKAQSDKYHYERERLKRARTTLFQVLMFEQDYAAAQLNRLRVETEVRGILTQMKTFGGKT
jgi:outer membrane protein TolC